MDIASDSFEVSIEKDILDGNSLNCKGILLFESSSRKVNNNRNIHCQRNEINLQTILLFI